MGGVEVGLPSLEALSLLLEVDRVAGWAQIWMCELRGGVSASPVVDEEALVRQGEFTGIVKAILRPKP